MFSDFTVHYVEVTKPIKLADEPVIAVKTDTNFLIKSPDFSDKFGI